MFNHKPPANISEDLKIANKLLIPWDNSHSLADRLEYNCAVSAEQATLGPRVESCYLCGFFIASRRKFETFCCIPLWKSFQRPLPLSVHKAQANYLPKNIRCAKWTLSGGHPCAGKSSLTLVVKGQWRHVRAQIMVPCWKLIPANRQEYPVLWLTIQLGPARTQTSGVASIKLEQQDFSHGQMLARRGPKQRWWNTMIDLNVEYHTRRSTLYG